MLVCSNMTGSNKLPLLEIEKFKKPRCSEVVSYLPVDYETNRTAWMQSTILPRDRKRAKPPAFLLALTHFLQIMLSHGPCIHACTVSKITITIFE